MEKVQKIGVVGSGQMGRGIAQVAAMSSYQVVLYDIDLQIVQKNHQFIRQQLDKMVSKQKISQQDADSSFSLISTSVDMQDLADCQLVVEAATENKNLKFDIFKQLDLIVNSQAILASNTSSISITEIAAQTSRPQKVVGMHFMNPVPVMKLVEGIKGLNTSHETFEAVKAVSENMGKVFIKSSDMPGFTVNRILMPMINEAVYALHEGVANVADIDIAMKLGTNQPMGPLTLADFIGLDTCLAIMNVLHEGLGDTKYRPCPLLKQYVAAGKLGRKVGSGFYEY